MKVIGVQGRSQGSLVQVQEDGGPVVEAWTPQTVEEVQAWNGVVPDGWELRDSKKGNKVLVEKKQQSRGGGGWRQSREGAEFESESIRRHQEIEWEHRFREQALMQAIQYAATVNTEPNGPYPLLTADQFYIWLRSSPAPGGQEPTNVAQEVVGAAPGPSGTEPGEVDDTGKVASPGSTRTFPMKPEDCNHRFGSGNWLTPITIAGMDHCPRCGMKTVLYRESDVGP